MHSVKWNYLILKINSHETLLCTAAKNCRVATTDTIFFSLYNINKKKSERSEKHIFLNFELVLILNWNYSLYLTIETHTSKPAITK